MGIRCSTGLPAHPPPCHLPLPPPAPPPYHRRGHPFRAFPHLKQPARLRRALCPSVDRPPGGAHRVTRPLTTCPPPEEPAVRPPSNLRTRARPFAGAFRRYKTVDRTFSPLSMIVAQSRKATPSPPPANTPHRAKRKTHSPSIKPPTWPHPLHQSPDTENRLIVRTLDPPPSPPAP